MGEIIIDMNSILESDVKNLEGFTIATIFYIAKNIAAIDKGFFMYC